MAGSRRQRAAGAAHGLRPRPTGYCRDAERAVLEQLFPPPRASAAGPPGTGGVYEEDPWEHEPCSLHACARGACTRMDCAPPGESGLAKRVRKRKAAAAAADVAAAVYGDGERGGGGGRGGGADALDRSQAAAAPCTLPQVRAVGTCVLERRAARQQAAPGTPVWPRRRALLRTGD